MSQAEEKTKRSIQLFPEAELARRIDVSAALAGKSAPKFVLGLLDESLPHYGTFPGVEPLQPSTVEAANGRAG